MATFISVAIKRGAHLTAEHQGKAVLSTWSVQFHCLLCADLELSHLLVSYLQRYEYVTVEYVCSIILPLCCALAKWGPKQCFVHFIKPVLGKKWYRENYMALRLEQFKKCYQCLRSQVLCSFLLRCRDFTSLAARRRTDHAGMASPLSSFLLDGQSTIFSSLLPCHAFLLHVDR